ncbi:MAG: amidohydrolase family protein [Acidimicrobiales bacterium]
MTTRVLTGGVDASGRPLEVRVDLGAGTVVAQAPSLDMAPGEEGVDCRGLVLLPAGAEPHVHLDKVATIGAAPNPSGELTGAVQAWLDYAPTLTFDGVRQRARGAIDRYVAAGATAMRTNVNVHASISPAVLEAIVAVRAEVAGRCDLQVVALVMAPLTGDSELARANRVLAERAVELGVDVIGGAPATDADPAGAVRFLVDVAARNECPVDLHVDETLDPAACCLLDYADAVASAGMGGRATAGHCVSLSVRTADEQARTAAILAEAGVAVVALAPTNLWLQGRQRPTATPRGVTPVRALLDAGVVVATGADNIEDPFCPLGRADLVDAARLLALTAHLSPAEAWAAASTSARRSMGLPVADLSVGTQADVLAIEGTDLDQALARASARRVVLRAGHVVAATTVTTTRPTP